MRRLVVLMVVLFGLVPTAEALTVRDIIELSKAGLGEDVLLALIDVEGGVYSIDPGTLKSLKSAGVPDRVIVALVRSGRERVEPPALPVATPEPEAPPSPQVVVIEHHDQPREVMVPVPVYVPVYTSRPRVRRTDGFGSQRAVESTFIPFQSGPPAERPVVQEPEREPVYWGFGGKLRPDAWKPQGHKAAARGRSDQK